MFTATSSRLIRTSVVLVLLILPGFMQAAAAANADPEPKDILAGIYTDAVKGKAPSDWLLEPKRRGKYLSKSMMALWAKVDKKRQEEDPMDWDPTTDTNALELRDFVITTKSRSETAAVLAVKMVYRDYTGPTSVITYSFVREDGHWRIDEMRSPKWSLSGHLKFWQKKGV
jgi:hypothetical protein